MNLICIQPNCPVARTGRCLEGQEPPQSCPHSKISEEGIPIVGAALREASEPPVDATERLLHDGQELDGKTISSVTSAVPCVTIVIAGDADSGKTTLIASVYEQFLQGQFAGFRFAGSRTLIGYEQRCYLSRLVSRRSTQDTQRTKYNSARYLHLKLQRTDLPRQKVDLLFADVPGELYRVARTSILECQRLLFLRRMEALVLLLDGKKLASPETRALALSNCRALLRMCLDSKMVPDYTHVMFVVTKSDLLDPSDPSFMTAIKENLRKTFVDRVRRLSFHEIAARPDRGSPVARGFGLAGLLPEWVSSPSLLVTENGSKTPTDLSRQFDRISYKWRFDQ